MGKDYYKLLGVGKNASAEEIKQAYKKLALVFHPDKNMSPGASDRFKDILEAYAILSDKAQKEIYDRYLDEKVKSNDISGNSFSSDNSGKDPLDAFTKSFYRDIFESDFFSDDDLFNMKHFIADLDEADNSFRAFNGPTLHKPQYRSKSFTAGQSSAGRYKIFKQDPPVEHTVFLSLEEILKGTIRKMKFPKKKLNPDGQSMRIEERILTLNIKPGSMAGTRIIFPKEGDQHPNRIPADIIFIIKVTPHRLFVREDAHIRFTAKITLKEALCGYGITIPTLNGKEKILCVNEIITTNTIKKIPNEGLPYMRNPNERGDLIVVFEIIFPEKLTDDVKNKLSVILT